MLGMIKADANSEDQATAEAEVMLSVVVAECSGVVVAAECRGVAVVAESGVMGVHCGIINRGMALLLQAKKAEKTAGKILQLGGVVVSIAADGFYPPLSTASQPIMAVTR